MKTLLLTGILVLLSVASLPAQNALPDPHNDSCWSSVSALQACQIQAEDLAQAQTRNCTSYPEYQCFDYYQPPQKEAALKSAPKATAESIHLSGRPSSPVANSSETLLQTGGRN